MQPVHFEQAVVSVIGRDKRFDAQAYFFLKDALDFTLKRIAEGNGGHSRHVSGQELLVGFRDFALDQFGPMGLTLMKEWGIRQCRDVGEMVFQLIDEGMFGKQDSDSLDDFSEIFDLEEALAEPFRPKRASATTNVAVSAAHS
jgi:uncharacterized repeat protein (TIGR04138 family)